MPEKESIFVEMKKWIGMLVFCSLAGLGKSQVLQVIDMDSYQRRVVVSKDSLYIVNFWATWCGPCVKELPYFLELKDKYIHEKVVFLFVSLNSLKEKDKVEQFVENKHLPLPSYLLHAGNPAVWIDLVEKEWSGSIPCTLFYQGGKKVFFKEGELGLTELEDKLKLFL